MKGKNMYAIVSTGGKQYKVATDDVITVEKIEGEAGSKVELEVIFLNDGKKIVTDPAKLAKAKVTAEILNSSRARSSSSTSSTSASAITVSRATVSSSPS